jgi:zinc protease
MAWLTPAAYKPGDAEADLLGVILGGGKASRLYRKLVYEQQIAQDVSVAQGSMMLQSVFQIEVTARPGVKPEQIEKAVDAELALLREQGPTESEVEQARNRMVSSIIQGLETTDGVADQLNRYNQFVGPPDYLQQDVARYAPLTPQLLRAAASRLLPPHMRVVVYCVPGDKVINDVPRSKPPANPPVPQKTAKDWRATQPAAGPMRPMQLPVPTQFKLANGLTVMLFEQHRLPLVSANLVVLAGSDRNPAARPGLASFTADAMDEGHGLGPSARAERVDPRTALGWFDADLCGLRDRFYRAMAIVALVREDETWAIAERGTPKLATPLPAGKTAGQQKIEDLDTCVRYTRELLQRL